MNVAQAIATLGLSGVNQLYSLMRNAQFPAPIGYDSNGNPEWNTAAIEAFAALMGAAAVWQIDLSTQAASADWATLAATTPGPSYVPAGDPLADVLDSWPGAALVASSSKPTPPPEDEGGAFVFSSSGNSAFVGLTRRRRAGFDRAVKISSIRFSA